MGKQPATGQKKTKDAIAKAAAQQKKKSGAKVIYPLCRNGPKEKFTKNLIMLSSLIRLATIN